LRRRVRRMIRTLLVGASVAVALGAAPRDHNPTYDDRFHAPLTQPGVPDRTRAYDLNGVDVSCTSDQLTQFVRNGVTRFPGTTCTNPNLHYAHTRNDLHFHDLNFDERYFDERSGNDEYRLEFNNLGGQGPENGCGCGDNPAGGCPSYIELGRPEATFIPLAEKLMNARLNAPAVGRQGLGNSCPGNPADDVTDPARIQLRRVTTIKCNGLNDPERPVGVPFGSINALACDSADRDSGNPNVFGGAVNLRIYSTSVYRPGDYGVDENGFQKRSAGTSSLFQINLRPVYNELAGPSHPTGACGPFSPPTDCLTYNEFDQPFIVQELLLILNNQMLLNILVAILPDLGANLFDARYTNTVVLAFIFTTDDGSAYPLEEFYLSFFDFDQDYADGAYALVRETLLVFDFTTVYMDESTEVSSRFVRPALQDSPSATSFWWAAVLWAFLCVRSIPTQSGCPSLVATEGISTTD